ncbi:hypothetical protein ACFVS9_22785 [Streptomyces sp. NPDC058008]|uniref:hypothetical protein n=1 Tax=Streptomyces sp. NPDC058008 TaxID=3346303 RepID=UPI0036EF3E7E
MASLTEPALLARPVAGLPATYVTCLLDGPEPSEEVAALLTAESRRYAELDTGHRPLFSEPERPVCVLLG